MAGVLKQEEAQRMIDALKKAAHDELYFPSGKGRLSFTAFGERRGDEFAVNIDRKGKLAEKCTYQGRVKQNNQVLMRLDIDPNAQHRNPDDTLIRGSHLHIYTEEYDMLVAIPFDVEDKNLFETCFTFFEKFHIIEPPDIIYQESVF